MFTITLSFSFTATHSHPTLRADHPFRETHSHNFVVTIELASATLNEQGFVMDYEDLEPVGAWLRERFGGSHLNDALGDDALTTAERFAEYLFHELQQRFALDKLTAVTVQQRPEDAATFRP